MKNKFGVFLILISLMPLSALAHSFKCRSGNVEIPFGPDQKESKEEIICMTTEPLRILSKNCLEGSCEAMTRPYPLSQDQYKISAIGTPGANLCTRLGGHAQVVNFLVDGKTTELDRCLFKDGSFMDLGSFWRFMTTEPDKRAEFLR
ncbi:hypothetical protein [Bdellovibrio bacteriovorus]|uniref:hypothetical protein n=1 Tax=Bdellovibrio bacteriovorus TaxID=959 RepID=UPI0035A58115